MKLPIFQSDDRILSMLQTKWASILNPVLGNPINSANLLAGVHLASGVTVVNHGLDRLPQGWFVVDINGAATIYRSAAFSPITLTLTSSAAVTVSLAVF